LGHSRSRGDEPAKLGEVLGNFINSHSRRATPWGLRRPEGSRPIVSLPSLPTLADERRLGVGLITGSVAWVWAASIAAIDWRRPTPRQPTPCDVGALIHWHRGIRAAFVFSPRPRIISFNVFAYVVLMMIFVGGFCRTNPCCRDL